MKARTIGLNRGIREGVETERLASSRLLRGLCHESPRVRTIAIAAVQRIQRAPGRYGTRELNWLTVKA